MSALSEKYGISEAAVKQMIKDGVISCSYEKYNEIWECYKNLSTTGKCDGIVLEVATRTGVGKTLVYDVINMFK